MTLHSSQVFTIGRYKSATRKKTGNCGSRGLHKGGLHTELRELTCHGPRVERANYDKRHRLC